MEMIQTNISAFLGIAFVLIGAINVWLMFHASSRMKEKGANALLTQAHRIGGYLFIALFCFMSYYMVIRMQSMPEDVALRPMVHMTLAMLLVPLLFSKVLIARYYKAYYSILLPLGLIIFTLGFVLIAITLGPYYLHRATMKEISLESINMGKSQIDLVAASDLLRKRCATCHNLDRVVSARKDAKGWLENVNRMRALPGANISEREARDIISYLVSQMAIDSSTEEGKVAVGKGIINAHCGQCHTLNIVYSAFKSPDEWKSTVERMEVYSGDGFLRQSEKEELLKFLADTQTPEAEAKRKEQANSEAVAKMENSKLPEQMNSSPASNLPAGIVLAVVALLFGLLVIRRPGGEPVFDLAALTSLKRVFKIGKEKQNQPQQNQPQQNQAKDANAEIRRRSLPLLLARVENQTSEAKSLRFLLPEGETFNFKPGQFLTFNWEVDGKKVIRSYSISSSPTQTGYVEITPKRIPNGLVSTYLTEKASVGLTVQAKGPSGLFYFDDSIKKVLFITAGSGITPVMSMLRYIDDKCLPVEVGLIYSVRKRADIIFERELALLQSRLPNFRSIITLTRPDTGWAGQSGRLSRAMVQRCINDIEGATCFICGPKAFMEKAIEILKELGVPDSHIKQESFGGPPVVFTGSFDNATAASILAAAEKAEEAKAASNRDFWSAPVTIRAETPIGQAEFVRSGKVCDITEGRTLLEIAEINAVAIPSSCRQGQCGTCVTRLIQGEVAMDAEDGLDSDLKEEGYILTCVGRAKGNVKLDA
ncbi:MAG: 2Fe-2S iron-sulfur cluster binding domain-containing protein [Blastocatellia bacterium]|nr:2Fe-2S iron-sulfur cluster binding domain-containing protein [Blastocatellia bacterium]